MNALRLSVRLAIAASLVLPIAAQSGLTKIDLSFRDTNLEQELHASPVPFAHAIDLGISCAGVELAATTPTLGATTTLTLERGLPGTTGLLLVSAPPAAPSAGPLVEAGCASWIDLTQSGVLGSGPGTGWSTSVPIPGDAGLQGLQVSVQAWLLPPWTLPAVTSNGLRLVLGV